VSHSWPKRRLDERLSQCGAGLDTTPREVEVPQALAAALAQDAAAHANFERLAYTHRQEYARWVDEAKRDETRHRRVSEALELLRQGKTRK
jgi:uncharacterized protein YdeI (YjbR/CyaY-like superfamily)